MAVLAGIAKRIGRAGVARRHESGNSPLLVRVPALLRRAVVAFTMQRTLFTAAAISLLFILPGCIAWEVRDEMRQANANLAGANWRLDEAGVRLNLANKNLDDANRRLDTATERINQTQASIDGVHRVLLATNQRLLEAEAELTKTGPMMDTTNQRLEDLMILRKVQASLQQIEATLGPLSKSMSSMGGLVSMLGLGGEVEPAPPLPPVATAPDAGAGAGAGGGAGDGAGAAAPAATDVASAPPALRTLSLLTGTWIMAFPIPEANAVQRQGGQRGPGGQGRQALVILSTGQYLLAVSGQPLATGAWVQQGKMLTLTPTTTPAPSSPPAAAAPTAAPVAEPIVMEILNNTPRLLSVRVGDEVRVYSRP